MIESRIHHIWIIDDEAYPIGIITLTDALSLFVPGYWSDAKELAT